MMVIGKIIQKMSGSTLRTGWNGDTGKTIHIMSGSQAVIIATDM